MTEDLMTPIVITIAVLVGLFFLLREVMCWYYKINDIKSLLKQIVVKLDALSTPEIVKNVETDAGMIASVGMKPVEVKVETSSDKTEEMISCKSCGEMRKPGGMCPHCGSWQT